MTDDAIADFRADVTLSGSDDVDGTSARVVVGDQQIVLVTEETRETIGLSTVFDVAQDVPADAPPDAQATVTLGYQRGESRETATIESRAGTLAKFQLVVFKLLLNGVDVTLKQTGNGRQLGQRAENGILQARSDGVAIECEDGTLGIERDSIEGFETSHGDTSGDGSEPTLTLFSTNRGQPVKTLINLPSFRALNLFGRFLQSSPDAGRENTSESTPRTVNVLIVDDDPGDIETIQMMLTQFDDRLDLTTATSAPGGLELLADESVDCVVSDYDMPGTDGIEFLEAVRERDPDLPFILFTGQGSEAVAKQAILGDATDYVEKGIGPEQYEILLARIKKAVR